MATQFQYKVGFLNGTHKLFDHIEMIKGGFEMTKIGKRQNCVTARNDQRKTCHKVLQENGWLQKYVLSLIITNLLKTQDVPNDSTHTYLYIST